MKYPPVVPPRSSPKDVRVHVIHILLLVTFFGAVYVNNLIVYTYDVYATVQNANAV
jgi:hypothetical protein